MGDAVLEAPEQIQNEFFNALLNKIGLQIFNDKEFGNPLLFLKKGTLEYGQTIEDIFVEMATPLTILQELGMVRMYLTNSLLIRRLSILPFITKY